MHRTVRALLSAAAAALSATTVIVGLTSGPAQAMTYASAPLTASAYTDKATPSTSNTSASGNFLIGSSTDTAGVTHTGRAYFTYDLTPFKGQLLHRVSFYTYERTVNDCSQTAPIEIWRTKPVTEATTWQHAPKELELLAEHAGGRGPAGICPGAYVEADMIPAIQAALARGEKTITLEVRVNAGSEADVGAGRTMSPAQMSYAVNHAPKIGGLKLKYPDAGCGTLEKHPSGGIFLQVQATATDADPGDFAQIYYAYWPVDHPEQRTETQQPGLGIDKFADGTVVAWTAQARDRDDAGPWGKTCYLTVDRTAPTSKPLVSSKLYSSEDYPGTGGPGLPGTFVFDAAGDPDVTGFLWDRQDGGLSEYVPANHRGGRAKVTITPTRQGPGHVGVSPVDAAGNRGPEVDYSYIVRDSAPLADFEVNGVGLTSHITLATRATDVTEFGYTIDGGPETRLPAVDRTAKGDIVFTSVGTKTVVERAYAGKKLIGSDTDQVSVSNAPKVTSEDFLFPNYPVSGKAGTFTFTPRTTDVVSYLYDFGDGNQQKIAAGADGSAVLTWTPESGGYYTITVYSVDRAGNRSLAADESFSVIDGRPYVDAATWGSHVGDAITVTAWSNLQNAVAMVYRFEGGPEQTVEGSYVNFDVVPTHSGDSIITVWAKLDDGTLSASTEYALHLDSGPGITARGPFGDGLVAGRPGTISFRASLPGAATFRYTINDGSQQEQAVGADGTATISYDVPDGLASVPVTVVSVAANGTESDTSSASLPALSTRVDVDMPWPDWTQNGGVGVAGEFGFHGYDLLDQTTKFLWHVNDDPVQEITPDSSAWGTLVSYTPDRAGENTLYVQREFTDGSTSAVQAFPFQVGG